MNIKKLFKIKSSTTKFSTKILVTSITTYFFLTVFVPSQIGYWNVALLAFDLIYMLLRKNIKFRIDTSSITGLVFLFTLLLGTFISSDFIVSLRYVFAIGLFFLNYLLLTDNDEWGALFYKQLKIVMLFFFTGSIIQLVSPSLIDNINSFHLLGENLRLSMRFVELEILVGFTNQSGINGFLLSVSLLIIVAELITQPKKILYILSLLITSYLILLTNKRGFIIFDALIILYLFIRGEKNKLRIVFLIPILVLAYYYLVFKTNAGTAILERSTTQDDISTGRFPIYNIMWNDFLSSPLIGKGTYTTSEIFSVGNGHNIYLQVLRENGILGILTFLSFTLTNLITSHKVIKSISLKSEEGKFAVISISLQILFLLWGLTGNTLYDNFVLIMYFVAIALIKHALFIHKTNKILE